MGTGRTQGKLQTLGLYIGILNVSGISYGHRVKYIKTEEDLLKIRPGKKLRKMTEMMKTQGIGLMTLSDTHRSKEGMEEVRTYLRQEGLGGGGIITRKEMNEETTLRARRRAGIYFIWDTTQMQVEDIEEVYESRVARAKVTVIDSGKEFTVYGVYMLVRNNKGGRVKDIWEKVMEDIAYRGTRNFIINGDFF
eukprot:4884016-Pleurochrysis_carterae.AAC.7